MFYTLVDLLRRQALQGGSRMSLLSLVSRRGLPVAGPIIFHLIRRATKDRIRFSAMRFLRESPPVAEEKPDSKSLATSPAA